MVNIVLVDAKGRARLNKVAVLTAEGIAKALRKAKEPTVLQVWRLTDEIEITLWGWCTAYAASVKSASFALPPPCGTRTLFGDLVITATGGGKPNDLSEETWETFRGMLNESNAVSGGGAEEEGAADIDGSDSESEAEPEPEINGDEVEIIEDDDVSIEDESEAGDAEEGEEAEEEADEEADAEEGEGEGEEEFDDDGECYDSDDGGGGKRRAPRRRAVAAPEFRRMEMGLRSRVKIPTPAGKRAPRWQTAPELEPEPEPEPATVA